MIRVQRDRRFDDKSVFIVRHNPHAHCARDRNLLMEILLGFTERSRVDHNRILAPCGMTVEYELGELCPPRGSGEISDYFSDCFNSATSSPFHKAAIVWLP